MERFSERIVSIILQMSEIYGLDRVFFHKLHHPPCCLGNFADYGRGVSKPKTEDRRPKTEDRRPKAEGRRPKAEDRLDLWPPSHFELGFFASRIGRLEIEF